MYLPTYVYLQIYAPLPCKFTYMCIKISGTKGNINKKRDKRKIETRKNHKEQIFNLIKKKNL